MANNGIKQATIAYRVEKDTGLPLDVNGELTSISGKKQAIALLVGKTNPNTALYEVQFYFAKSAEIDGEPTSTYDLKTCPVGAISIVPTSLLVEISAPSATFTINSTHPWALISGPTGFVTFSQNNGPRGDTVVTVTRTTTQGDGYYIFRNLTTNQTATIYILNVDVKEWILATGLWKNLGIWQNTGLWIY